MAIPTIRYARETDAADITELLSQLEHPSSVEHVRKKIKVAGLNDREHVLVAVSDIKKVVGVLTLQIAEQFHQEPPVARILDLCILDSYRARTYGRQLFSAAQHIAERCGCCRMEVTANNFRLGAHQFYALMGMDQTHRYFAKKL